LFFYQYQKKRQTHLPSRTWKNLLFDIFCFWQKKKKQQILLRKIINLHSLSVIFSKKWICLFNLSHKWNTCIIIKQISYEKKFFVNSMAYMPISRFILDTYANRLFFVSIRLYSCKDSSSVYIYIIFHIENCMHIPVLMLWLHLSLKKKVISFRILLIRYLFIFLTRSYK
jgi:hypothetical protein